MQALNNGFDLDLGLAIEHYCSLKYDFKTALLGSYKV